MARNNNQNSNVNIGGSNRSNVNIGGGNSNNNRNNNSNRYNYNPDLLFRPDSLYPGSLFSPRRQPPQQGGQGHKCRDGKTPRPEQFNNKRCRNPDTEIKYPYMRQKLKDRLRNLGLHGADGDTDGYLKWVWPYRKSEQRGSYDRNNRYKVVKRPDLNGIPRFSINHYLKQNCAASAITTTLPRLIKNKNKNDDKIYFSTATESQPKKQADLDWKRKIIADRIGKLPARQRRRVCQQIKENYVERNASVGWSELYNNEMLTRMHGMYLGEQGPQSPARSQVTQSPAQSQVIQSPAQIQAHTTSERSLQNVPNNSTSVHTTNLAKLLNKNLLGAFNRHHFTNLSNVNFSPLLNMSPGELQRLLKEMSPPAGR